MHKSAIILGGFSWLHSKEPTDLLLRARMAGLALCPGWWLSPVTVGGFLQQTGMGAMVDFHLPRLSVYLFLLPHQSVNQQYLDTAFHQKVPPIFTYVLPPPTSFFSLFFLKKNTFCKTEDPGWSHFGKRAIASSDTVSGAGMMIYLNKFAYIYI